MNTENSHIKATSLSGIARTSLMLGHSMSTQCTCTFVQTSAQSAAAFGGRGSGGASPENLGILQPPMSVLRLYHKSLTVSLRTVSVAINLQSTTILIRVLRIQLHTFTGGAWPLFAIGHMPKCAPAWLCH